MRAVFDLIRKWVTPFLSGAGLNAGLVVKALKLGYDLMVEVDKQRKEGDGQFTNEEKAAWVKQQLREQTGLSDSVIDFVFGIAIARFIREKREKPTATT